VQVPVETPKSRYVTRDLDEEADRHLAALQDPVASSAPPRDRPGP
jgi:hypothetical protein